MSSVSPSISLLHGRKPCIAALALAVLLAAPVCSFGQATQPAEVAPAPVAAAPLRPLLQQLDEELRSVNQQLQAGIVRVQLPAPRRVNELTQRINPADTWGNQLSPQMRTALEQSQAEYAQGSVRQVHVSISATTGPVAVTASGMPPALGSPRAADGTALGVTPSMGFPGGTQAPPSSRTPANVGPAWTITANAADHTMVARSGGEDANAALQLHAGSAPDNDISSPGVGIVVQNADSFAPNNIGLVLDDRGHIVVPLYLEKEAIGHNGVRVMASDGTMTRAQFTASDLTTNLTVLKLDKPLGKAIKDGPRRPADGSLFILLSPNTASGQLLIWSGGEHEYGVICGVDGSVCGFDRHGQILSIAAARPVIGQLIDYGKVRRAILGVGVSQVLASDPIRQDIPALGGQSALRIDTVTAGSAAAKVGLHQGDFILAIGDDKVENTVNFAIAISSRSGVTPLTVLRDGQSIVINVVLTPE